MHSQTVTNQNSRSHTAFLPVVQPTVTRTSIFPEVATGNNDATFSMSEISYRLKITPLAIFKWRKGSRQRTPLPVTRYRLGDSCRYVIEEKRLIGWVSSNRPDLLDRWRKTA